MFFLTLSSIEFLEKSELERNNVSLNSTNLENNSPKKTEHIFVNFCALLRMWHNVRLPINFPPSYQSISRVVINRGEATLRWCYTGQFLTQQRCKNLKPVQSCATRCGSKCCVKNRLQTSCYTYRFFVQQYYFKNCH